MNKKTIAIVANSTWNIYNFRLNLIKALVAQGCKVVVIAPVDEYIHYLNKVEGIHHLPLKRLTRNSTSPFQEIRLFFELLRIYRRIQPDLVIHYTIKPNIYGNLAAFFCRLTSICVITGLGYSFLKKGWIRMITFLQYRLSFKFAKAIVFHNPDDQELFQKAKIVKPGNSITILGSGVDTHYFKSYKQTERKKNIFTFIGRLLYDKGIEDFVHAAREINNSEHDAEFWVIGEMDEKNPSYVPKQKLLRWIENKDIRYFGTAHDIRPFIEDATCIVLPSYREGLSKVLLEALSMGKPIITTDAPGCKQAVSHRENGLLVPQKNPTALALAMEYFIKLSDEQKEKMGQLSRKLALEKFDDRVIIDQYFNIIMKVAPEFQFTRKDRSKVH